jgi:hypothetical protein
MAWNFASSVESVVQVGTGVQLLDAANANFFTAALDEAANQYADTPVEGSKYYKVKNVDKNNYTSQAVHGIGLAQVNSDAEDLPVDKQVIGFESTISNYVLRNAMAIGREVLETDRFGVIGEHSRNLMHSGKKTIERVLADSFNRGFGTTNLSVLAEDGLGFFSASRPQARASATDWSNLASTGDLTADSVASARVSFNTYLDGNGDLDPQMLEKVIVSPELEDTMREISGTTLKVDTSLNNTNVVSGTSYDCYHWLDAGTIIYCGDGDNGLEFHVRQNPSVLTYNDGSNPDKIWSRMRMAIGTGLKRPGKFIGQQTT